MAEGFGEIGLKAQVTPEEWQARVDLAALYRLAAKAGWDDMIFTHISARVPGPEHHFLINPLGLFFEEITASSLVKIDLDGAPVDDPAARVSRAGFVIHSALHQARDDARFVIHLHTDYTVAVSAQREGLLPITQRALAVLPNLAYHDYKGIGEDLAGRERLVADIGDKALLLLRNHGALSVGATAAEAWLAMYYLNRACAYQVMAGPDAVRLSQALQDEVRSQANYNPYAAIAWPGLLRSLDRALPGYDA